MSVRVFCLAIWISDEDEVNPTAPKKPKTAETKLGQAAVHEQAYSEICEFYHFFYV